MLSVTISNGLREKTAFGKNTLGSVNAEYEIQDSDSQNQIYENTAQRTNEYVNYPESGLQIWVMLEIEILANPSSDGQTTIGSIILIPN